MNEATPSVAIKVRPDKISILSGMTPDTAFEPDLNRLHDELLKTAAAIINNCPPGARPRDIKIGFTTYETGYGWGLWTSSLSVEWIEEKKVSNA